MTRYRWVAARRAEGFPTTAACRAAGVSRQAFYDWSGQQASGPSAKASADAELVDVIKQVHADSGGAYGSPRVTAELRRQGRRANPKRVCRLMRLNGICGNHKRRKPRWRGAGGARPAPADLVRRDFRPGPPDRGWAGDINYIPTGDGWVYLAAMLDVGSRKLIGYSMATHMAAQLAVDALDTAAASRGGCTAGVIFHSDMGPQYLSGDFASALARHRMRQSASRAGNAGTTAPPSRSPHPGARARLPNPIRDPRPSPPGDLRLDRPLQHTANPLHPQLPDPHRMGRTPPATTKPSRISQVSSQRGEPHMWPRRASQRVLPSVALRAR